MACSHCRNFDYETATICVEKTRYIYEPEEYMDTKCTTETEEVCAYSNVRIEICTSSSSYMFNYQVTVVRKYNTTECSTTYETNCTPAAPTTVDNPKENCVEKPTETCEVVEKEKIEKEGFLYLCNHILVINCKEVTQIPQKEIHYQECTEMTARTEMTEELCKDLYCKNAYLVQEVPYKDCRRLDCDSYLKSD